MDNNKSEFNYREDIQMVSSALYANDLSRDFFQLVHTNTGSMLFLSLAMLPAYASFVYTSSPDRQVDRVEYAKEVLELPYNNFIEQVPRPVLSPFVQLSERARMFATLPQSVSNSGLAVPTPEVAENAARFISSMERNGIACPDENDVMPSAFGTVVIDFYNERGLVSIEVGRTKVGFFTDYEDGINEESDGLATDFRSIPAQLLKHLKNEA